MGLAASQARLLTLTSRCIDLELKCMQLSAEQIRNASAACSLSEDYNNQLDVLEARSKTEGDPLCIYKNNDASKDLTEDDIKLAAADIKNLGYNVVLSKFANDNGTVAAPEVRTPDQIKANIDAVKQASFEPRNNYDFAVKQIESLENQNTELVAAKEAYIESANLSTDQVKELKQQVDTSITEFQTTINDRSTDISTEEGNIRTASSDISRYGAECATQRARMNQASVDMNAMTKDSDGNYVPDEKVRARAQEIFNDAQTKFGNASNAKMQAESDKTAAEQRKSDAERLKREAEDNKRAAEAKSKAYQEKIDNTNLDVEAKCKEIDGKISNNNTTKGVYEASRDNVKLIVEAYDKSIADLEGELAISQNVYSDDENKMLSDAEVNNSTLVSNLLNGSLVIVDGSGHKCSYDDLVQTLLSRYTASSGESGTTIDRTAYNEAKDKADRDYDLAQKKLSLADKRIQMEMTQTQTQLNACNKEMESVKTLIDKNIERGFDYSI